MNYKGLIFFCCVTTATLTFAQDASTATQSTTLNISATGGNPVGNSSGSAQNASPNEAFNGNGSSTPPAGSQDQNSATATGGTSSQGTLTVTSPDSTSRQQNSGTQGSSSLSANPTESQSTTIASTGEESATTKSSSESSSESSTNGQQSNATNNESSETASTSQSSVSDSSDSAETTSPVSEATSTSTAASVGTNSQPGNRESDQQTQGNENQVGAQGRALDNYGGPRASQRTTTRRNIATSVSAASNNINNKISPTLTNSASGTSGNYGPIQTNAQWTPITEMNVQSPNVWEALGQLRGNNKGRNVQDPLNSVQVYDLIATAQAGSDYPNYSEIPTTGFSCEQVNQPGFYADAEARCQVFRRCDTNAVQYSYLCPNMTIFNQITLVCDWFFNVDCAQSRQFYDYSNRRLYHGSDWVLLSDDSQSQTTGAATTRDPLLEI